VAMTFASLPAGTAVFIDANPFVYAVTADPRYGPACDQLLQRVENKELTGFTSAHVVAEMAPPPDDHRGGVLAGPSPGRDGELAQAAPAGGTAAEPFAPGDR
jgi:hypothetical protein